MLGSNGSGSIPRSLLLPFDDTETTMSITTQDGALDALRATCTAIGRQVTRYDTGGAAVKAAAALELAGLFTAMAVIYDQLPKLYSGRRPARWLAAMASADAAELNRQRAADWRLRADADQAKADWIERQALPAFADDGMTYVPGLGRVRRQRLTDGATGEQMDVRSRARLRWLEGGQ